MLADEPTSPTVDENDRLPSLFHGQQFSKGKMQFRLKDSTKATSVCVILSREQRTRRRCILTLHSGPLSDRLITLFDSLTVHSHQHSLLHTNQQPRLSVTLQSTALRCHLHHQRFSIDSPSPLSETCIEQRARLWQTAYISLPQPLFRCTFPFDLPTIHSCALPFPLSPRKKSILQRSS